MQYRISLTHKKCFPFDSLGMKFGTIYISKRLGCLWGFASGWKVNVNQEQWSLCPETCLCAECEVKAPFFFFFWASLKLCLFSLGLGDRLLHIFSRGCFACMTLYLNVQVTYTVCFFPPPLQSLYQAVSKHKPMSIFYSSLFMCFPCNQHQVLDSLALQ